MQYRHGCLPFIAGASALSGSGSVTNMKPAAPMRIKTTIPKARTK